MILIGIRPDAHDSNIAVSEVSARSKPMLAYYSKYERDINVKHATLNLVNRLTRDELSDAELFVARDWIISVLERAGIDWQKANNIEVCVVADDNLDQAIYQKAFNRMFPNHFVAVILVDHHTAHITSTWPMLPQLLPEYVQNIVADGFGNQSQCLTHYATPRGNSMLWTFEETKHGNHRTHPVGSASIGLAHADLAAWLGIQGHPEDLAGKLMGLQQHGKEIPELSKILKQYPITSIEMVFMWYRNYPADNIDIAHTLCKWAGNALTKWFKHRLTAAVTGYCRRTDLVTYTGGVALNIFYNSKLHASCKKLIIPPHASDDGLSLGALYIAIRSRFTTDIELVGFPYCQLGDDSTPTTYSTTQRVVDDLIDNRVVGIFRGQGEIGPRALGNRSILTSATDPEIITILNNKVKFREAYRPYGAVVLEEDFDEYFTGPKDPYMLYACKVKGKRLPAVTAAGYSRVQIVSQSTNPALYDILVEYKRRTGISVLLNTSLNASGFPIANTYDQALEVVKQSKHPFNIHILK